MEMTTQEALAHDFDADRKQITVAGRQLNYISLGDPQKPVLLYVHGLAGTWRNWIFNLLPFADRFHVIAVDLPGFGDSEMPSGRLSISGYVDTLKEFLELLGIERVTLVGNSMGGQIGAAVGKRAPELLERLVLVDPAGFSTASRALQRLSLLAPLLGALLGLCAKFRKQLAFNRWLAAALTKIVLFKPMAIGGELMLLLLEGIGKPGFVPAIQALVHDPIKLVPGVVEVPTVIVWGRNDLLIPKKDAFKFARMIPGSQIELLDNVGHIPMFEAPDRFNAVIESIVAEPTLTAAATS